MSNCGSWRSARVHPAFRKGRSNREPLDGFGVLANYSYIDSSTALSNRRTGASRGEGVFFDEYETLDASVRYDFGRFGVYADATNITDSEQLRYTGSREAVSIYAIQGRRFSVGVSAKF